MAEKTSIEIAIVEIVEMAKKASQTRVTLEKEANEVEQLLLTKKEIQGEIKKAKERKDKSLEKMRETEDWAKREITRAKGSANSERRLAEEKKKAIFNEMTADIKLEKEKNDDLKKENRELTEEGNELRVNLQKLKEGISC